MTVAASRLVLIGGGRMGEALLGGVLTSGWISPSDVSVVETAAARRSQLAVSFPDVEVVGALPGSVRSAGVVVAVKPADVEGACRAVGAAGAGRVLSIAAGIPLQRLEEWVGSETPVLRAMPNTPALIGAGVAAVAAGSGASDADLVWAEGLLGSVGTVVRVQEKLLDAVTGLSGSGPAYVFLVAEALIDAGVLAGLPRDISATLAAATLLGAARMLVESGEGPEALRAAVTSPGGTTAAGLRVLEGAGIRAAFLDAVMAATERSVELGRASG